MVDTSRTLAEIKAILADNTTRDITPQDLRDVVESIVNPIGDGGFPTKASARAPECNANWQRWKQAGIQTIPSSYQWNPVEVDTTDLLHDPSGLFQTIPYFSSYLNKTFPPLSWALLSEGVWQLTTVTTFDGSNYYRASSLGIIDDYATDYDDYIVTYGTTTSFSPVTAVASGQATLVTSECLVVPAGRTYRVGYMIAQASGSPTPISFLEPAIQLLSP